MIGDSQFLYGFARRSPYAVYVTDLVRLWHDCPTEDSVCKKAVLAGVADFDALKLEVFVSQLEELFVSSDRLRFFPPATDDSIAVEAPLSKDFVWTLLLQPAPPEVAAAFFSQQLTRSLLNHNFLLYKIARLEEIMRAKDNYTLYLEENYKTVNGSELIDKYKRQHPNEAESMAKYNHDATGISICSAYRNLTLKHMAKADASDDLLFWNYISAAVNDFQTWKSSAVKSESISIKEEPTPSLKREIEHSSSGGLSTKKVKLEPSELKIKQKQISPRRKRIGMIRRQ